MSDEHLHDDTFEFELPATHGDLVEVDGYEWRVFRVTGYRHEIYKYPNETWTDLVYELVDVVTSEWLEADAEDLELLADEANADRYMQTIDYKNYPRNQTFSYGKETVSMAKGERKLTPREQSAKEAEERKQARKEKAEQIDNLLDIANWNRKMLEKTNDEAYGDRLLAVEAELKKLTDDE